MKSFKFGDHEISPYSPPFIIAELSANHNGSIDRAKSIIKLAKESGADAVKIQSYEPDTLTLNSSKPDFVIDISSQIDLKIKLIKTYKTQFYNPDSKETHTIISSKDFLESIKYRAKDLGRQSNCQYAEGFISQQLSKLESLLDIK